MERNSFSIKNFIDEKILQRMQDNFALATGVGMFIVDSEGRPLTIPSGEPKLCSKLFKDRPRKEPFGGQRCLPTFLGGYGVVDKNLSYVCDADAGMHNFVVPFRLSDGMVVAYAVLGPVILIMRKSKDEYRQSAEELGVDVEELWNAVLEIKVVSLHGIQSLIDLIRDIGEYIMNITYLNYMHKRGQQETLKAGKNEHLLKVLHDLLEVAFDVSKADVGSVMFFEPDGKHLTIRASKNVPEDIVKNTRVRIGEGLAGIAAQEQRPMLIDNNNRDNRIKAYLNRPQLASSMILPIQVHEKVSGIMNLAAFETSSVRFSNQDMNLLKRLVDLAAVAIR
jgi:ligand-binding sensor protein/putative methionine-R-sulfoxide reductase with GAF domain